MRITSSIATLKTPTTVALGNFDGLHPGHQRVIQPIGQPDSQLRLVQSHPVSPTVVTFHPHPQEFFTGQRRLLLTPLAEKGQLLQQLGVEQLLLLPFDQQLASYSPLQFVQDILIAQLQVELISVGQDFRFGCNRSGTITDLQQIAAQFGIPVMIAPLCYQAGDRISSSAIRQALSEGHLARANQLLGRSYSLLGEVVVGQQLGRTIGFPTANLQVPPEKFLPRSGVYSVWVKLASESRLPGIMNIGWRPTVSGKQQTIEIHLLDWTGDLYGQTIAVSLEHFLRSEQKFASLDDLKAQIHRDSEQARELLALQPV